MVPFNMSEESSVGNCPICDRVMYDDGSCDKHHFLPKSKGGKESLLVHRVCHVKVHSLWTEAEIARDYYTPELVRAAPRNPEVRQVGLEEGPLVLRPKLPSQPQKVTGSKILRSSV